MKFKKFNSSADTRIEHLYEYADSIAVRTKSDDVYTKCEVTWEQGRVRSAVFDNYRFTNGSVTIWPEDVVDVSYEGMVLPEDDSVLKIYELHLGWRGVVIVTAFTKEEAKQKMRANREVDDDELQNIVQKDLTDEYVYVNYGDE